MKFAASILALAFVAVQVAAGPVFTSQVPPGIHTSEGPIRGTASHGPVTVTHTVKAPITKTVTRIVTGSPVPTCTNWVTSTAYSSVITTRTVTVPVQSSYHHRPHSSHHPRPHSSHHPGYPHRSHQPSAPNPSPMPSPWM